MQLDCSFNWVNDLWNRKVANAAAKQLKKWLPVILLLLTDAMVPQVDIITFIVVMQLHILPGIPKRELNYLAMMMHKFLRYMELCQESEVGPHGA